MGRGSSAVAHRRRLVGGPTGDNEGGRVFGKQNKIKIKIKIKWERKKKWGWRDAEKGSCGSGHWGRAVGREVGWSVVKEEEDGEGKKKKYESRTCGSSGGEEKNQKQKYPAPPFGWGAGRVSEWREERGERTEKWGEKS